MPDTDNIALVVTMPFGKYAVGDKITDPAEIEKVLETNDAYVVRVRV